MMQSQYLEESFRWFIFNGVGNGAKCSQVCVRGGDGDHSCTAGRILRQRAGVIRRRTERGRVVVCVDQVHRKGIYGRVAGRILHDDI